MRRWLSTIILSLVIIMVASTTTITLAEDPDKPAKERVQISTTDWNLTFSGSRFFAENPELMVFHRYRVPINQPTGSAFYAQNPELLAIQRYEGIAQRGRAPGSAYYSNPQLLAAQQHEGKIVRRLASINGR